MAEDTNDLESQLRLLQVENERLRSQQPTISERANELHTEISAREVNPARDANPTPPPELMAELKRYYAETRAELQQQITEIETFLGFVDHSGDLAVRVAKLEAFTGINRG
jgi:chaperonin cofactor prefoldin